jgi:hypothetical protein
MPFPCDDWSVLDILNHLVEQLGRLRSARPAGHHADRRGAAPVLRPDRSIPADRRLVAPTSPKR